VCADHPKTVGTGTVVDPGDQETLIGPETSLRQRGEGIAPNESSALKSFGCVGHGMSGRHRSVEVGEERSDVIG